MSMPAALACGVFVLVRWKVQGGGSGLLVVRAAGCRRRHRERHRRRGHEARGACRLRDARMRRRRVRRVVPLRLCMRDIVRLRNALARTEFERERPRMLLLALEGIGGPGATHERGIGVWVRWERQRRDGDRRYRALRRWLRVGERLACLPRYCEPLWAAASPIRLLLLLLLLLHSSRLRWCRHLETCRRRCSHHLRLRRSTRHHSSPSPAYSASEASSPPCLY